MDIEERSSELKIDTSVLINQGDTYSSLTDLSRIPLFTTSFQEITERVATERKQNNQRIVEQVFQNSMTDSDENEQLIQLLFQGEKEQARRREVGIQGEGMSLHIYPTMGLTVLLFLTGLLYYCKKRSQNRGA